MSNQPGLAESCHRGCLAICWLNAKRLPHANQGGQDMLLPQCPGGLQAPTRLKDVQNTASKRLKGPISESLQLEVMKVACSAAHLKARTASQAIPHQNEAVFGERPQ